MDPLITLLNHIFDQKFPGSVHPLHPIVPESTNLSGYIIWDGFETQTYIERQAEVWKTIRENTDVPDQRRITAIFAMTPAEEQAILENE